MELNSDAVRRRRGPASWRESGTHATRGVRRVRRRLRAARLRLTAVARASQDADAADLTQTSSGRGPPRLPIRSTTRRATGAFRAGSSRDAEKLLDTARRRRPGDRGTGDTDVTNAWKRRKTCVPSAAMSGRVGQGVPRQSLLDWAAGRSATSPAGDLAGVLALCCRRVRPAGDAAASLGMSVVAVYAAKSGYCTSARGDRGQGRRPARVGSRRSRWHHPKIVPVRSASTPWLSGGLPEARTGAAGRHLDACALCRRSSIDASPARSWGTDAGRRAIS